MKVEFDQYAGKTRVELLRMAVTFHSKFQNDSDLVQTLQSIMYPQHWEEMLALEPLEEETLIMAEPDSSIEP